MPTVVFEAINSEGYVINAFDRVEEAFLCLRRNGGKGTIWRVERLGAGMTEHTCVGEWTPSNH